MSGGGGFRGRGFGPHGYRRQGPRPELSGNSGSRQGGLGGPRLDDPASRPSGFNLCSDVPNSGMGGPGYSMRGSRGPSRGPCPNFNHVRRPPMHQARPLDNWGSRGGSPHFSPWRGGRPQRFNGPPRPFYHGRGQAPYMPRFPYMQSGNFLQPYIQFPSVPEPKPIESKPAIPHLGSEEERQQKITEAADALKRKLSAVAKEPDVWRDDDDEGLAEYSRDADHDSRITNKGIPELKHDPPELNLTLGDLRDIGRVDHDHRTEQPKTSSKTDENFACDDFEVEILAHNPVRPTIEIDLWSDDNYGEYGEDECGNRATEKAGASSETQDTSGNTQCDAYSASYGFQSFSDNCMSYTNDFTSDDYGQSSSNKGQVELAAEQETPSMETVIEGQSQTAVECSTEKPDAVQQIDSIRSGECDKTHDMTVIDSSADKIDADTTIVEQDEVRTTGAADSEEFHGESSQLKHSPEKQDETTTEASKKMLPEIRDEEAVGIRDNLDELNVNETISKSERMEGKIGVENATERLDGHWVVLSKSGQDYNARIPGLDSLYTNETMEQSSGVTQTKNVNLSEIIGKSETTIAGREIKENDIINLQSGGETAIVAKETKVSGKEMTSENVDRMSIQRSEVCTKSRNRVESESESRKDDTAREIRHGTSKAGRDEKQDWAFSGFGDKVTNEAKEDAIATKSHDAAQRERPDEKEQKIQDEITGETSRERGREKKQERSKDSDSQSKIEKAQISTGRLEKQNKESSKKTDSRDNIEATVKIDAPREKSGAKIEKSSETLSSIDKKADVREPANQEEQLTDQKFREKRKLVRKMAEGYVGSRNRFRASIVTNVPTEFDPHEPPPMSCAKNFVIPKPTKRQNAVTADFYPKQLPPMRVISQDTAESPQIPPAFDPRLSAMHRNALLPTGPSVSSVMPVTQEFGIQQGYPPRTITNFASISSPMNYGHAPIVVGTNVEPSTNIQPICLSDPYTTLLSLPSMPVAAPIAVSHDTSLIVPPLPAAPPPPLPAPAKSNLDMDDGLEDMQEAMKFAKQLMNMNERRGSVDEANSADTDFFHMPTFPNLPPVELSPEELPPLPLDAIPTPPEDKKMSVSQTTTNRESKKSKSNKEERKLESVCHEFQPMPEVLRKNANCSNETNKESPNLTDEQIRPKVIFNLNPKIKVLSKDNEWQQQQYREEAAEAAVAAAAATAAMTTITSMEIGKYRKNKLPSSPTITPTSKEKIRVANDHEDFKKSRNASADKSETMTSKLNGDNLQIKKPAESQTQSRSRSSSPTRTKQTKHVKNEDSPSMNSERCELLPRRVTKESTSKKSTDETPESSWKNRVIGRFLKMSKNDICNMLNNTGLRKFDIAMKHLVKERRSSLSLGMRNNEGEKLKDSEASYNREEFMDQLSAMLDPSATVDVCNLPTQFIHHLSEVLQLESMSEFQTGSSTPSSTPSEHVEAKASTLPQQAPQYAARLSNESANAREIDDRRPSKRGREKKSMNAGSAMDTIVATTPPARTTDLRSALKPCEESVEAKCAIKRENIVEEVQKNPATIVPRARRRHHYRSAITDQPEISTGTINGSTSQENSSSLNMADVDDIFTAGIARAKKKPTRTSKNEIIAGEFNNEVNSRCKEVERDATPYIPKDTSVDGVERAAVELDKIFTAGIARAKLASKKAAAAATKAAEANDADDDEDDAGWKQGDGKLNLHANRLKHRSSSRHSNKCEKWNQRKAHEDPDAFRNLTKEEWEAKYSETSDSTYEREYRAMVVTKGRKAGRSPTCLTEDHESYAVEPSGSVMSRLGSIVTGDSGFIVSWSDDDGRRLRYSNDRVDYPMGAHHRNSEDDSSSSTTTSTTSESSEENGCEESSVTKLLKVIKAREKIGRKKSVNEEIRDEVTAEIERKRRERGKVSRKGHRSRTKKSHRRKKDRKMKMRERKKRDRKRKKRKSRKSGSEEGESNSNEDTDEEVATSSMRDQQRRQLLTEKEIKKENDIIVVKDESENRRERSELAKPRSKSALAMRAIDETHSSCTSSVSSMPALVGVAATTTSPLTNQTKTKAQLKQLPVSTNKIAAVPEFPNETPKKQIVASTISEVSSIVNDSTISSQSTDKVPTSSSMLTHTTAIPSDEIPVKINSKKLDINTYKERAKLRLQRENEKLRFAQENPSSLTQDLLNIPLTRKKLVEKSESIVLSVEQRNDPRLTKNEAVASTAINDTTTCATTNKTATSTTAAETLPANTATAKNVTIATPITKIPIIGTTTSKIPTILTTTTKIPTISTTSAETAEISTTTVKTSVISTMTTKTPTISTITTKLSTVGTTSTKTSEISTTIAKISTINTTAAKSPKLNVTTALIPSTVASAKVGISESTAVQQSTTTKLPAKKLIRLKNLTKIADGKSTVAEARVDVGKFAHIKSEGRKELKLREKLKKGRRRVSSDALETTIPLIKQPRVKKCPIISPVTTVEQTAILLVKQKIEEAPVKKRCDYFKKGVVSDVLPDTVPQEFFPVLREESTKINELLVQQPELDDLPLPIAELSSWPLDPSIPTSIVDEVDSDDSPPFKGFAKEPILRRDRVLTEAEINLEIDALDTVPLAFEAGPEEPVSTVVDLNDLRNAEISLNEPISYGDEEFVEGRVEMETTLLGFSVTNDIPDDPEAIATLGDDEFVAENIQRLPEKIAEESCESLDILPRVTSTLSDSPATIDLLIAEVQRRESIPSPLLVTESISDENEESLVTDLSSNNFEDKKKMVNTSSDDAVEVTSSHESHNDANGTVYVKATTLDFDTGSSVITSAAGGKDISFRTRVTNVRDVDKAENMAEAQEMLEKRVILDDRGAKDVSTRDTTLETLHTPPPQPSSSSDSTDERGKKITREKQREAIETHCNVTKSKESSHHSHFKSKEHSHGRNKRKSSRNNNRESKMKMKAVITEKMVEEAVTSNIVKLVPKPTSKETVMARMIEIDVEIHKLMNEKMMLYKMLESGQFPTKEDTAETSYARANVEPKAPSETEEIPEIVPPTVLASRLVRNLDKAVLATSEVMPNESPKESNRMKGAVDDEGRKRRRKTSPLLEIKNQRTKDNESREGRRQRKISDSKSHSRRTTSEESSRHESASTHSREKSTSSTEPDDTEEKSYKRKTKSLQHHSPIRQSSKCSHEHSSREDLREGSRESTTERSVKSTKQETQNLLEESAKLKLKKKTKNLDVKKTEETARTKKEKNLSDASKTSEMVETSGKRTVGDGERSLIYSDESTWDSLEPEANQSDEQRGKKDGGASTGLALLEESFKREIAETKKLKAMERRKGKQELRRILLSASALTPGGEEITNKESLVVAKGKDKLASTSKDPSKVWKHVTTVIDAVAEDRIDQLYNDETSSEPRDSVLGSSPIRDCVAGEKTEENLSETVEEATEIAESSKDDPEVPEDSKVVDSIKSGAISTPVDEERKELEERTEVSDGKAISDNEDIRKTPEDNLSSEENTQKSVESDTPVERSTVKTEKEISSEENAKQTVDDNCKEESAIKTLVNIPANEKEENMEETEENPSSTTLNKSQLVADRKKEMKNNKTEDSRSTSPGVSLTVSKTTEETKEKREKKKETKDQILVKESIKESVKKASESCKERQRAKEPETERVRSKIRNGRSEKQSNVVLRDTPPKEKRPNDMGKHNSSKARDSKIHTEKSPRRSRSATKRKQRDNSTPPNCRSSRYSEDRGRSSRNKKKEKSSSRGTSPYDGEPSKKRARHSRRSSSPLSQVSLNEEQIRRRGQKRRRHPQMSRDEMASCKVLLIDCKYTYLSPKMHPRILKKLGISKINPYIPPKLVAETETTPKLKRVETSSPPILCKVEVSKETKESPLHLKESSPSPMERTSSPMEPPPSPMQCTPCSMESPPPLKERSSSPKERPLSPKERLSSPKERPPSPKECSLSPKERPLSPKERSSSPKQPSPSPMESPPPPKESPPSPKVLPQSPTESPSPKEPHSSPIEFSSSPKHKPPPLTEVDNRMEVDEDDDEDDEVDDAFDENIQIVKLADESLPLTSQSEDDEAEAEGAVDIVEEAESVVDVAEEAEDVVNVVKESAVPPDSTADAIVVDNESKNNAHECNIQEADTTDEIEVLEEKITIVDKTNEIQELRESEAEDEDIEPRRTRYTVHKGPILDIKVLDDSFLAASEDGAIYRYSQKSNGILNIYKGHEAAVTCIYVLEMSGEHWKLYSGSLDGTFRCYDITTGVQERPPADVGSAVQCMDQAWGVIFVGTKSGHISRYNIKSGSIKGDRLEFSDKSVLALKASSEGPRRILIVASRNQPITIRDALTGLFLRTVCGYKNHTVYSLMRERNLVYCGTSSTSIPVFDFTNGEQITQYNAGVGIVCMRLYRQILFAGCYDGNIYVFDTKETKLICSIPGPGNMLLSMEIVGDEIIAGSKNRQLHSWRMPRQVRALLSERT